MTQQGPQKFDLRALLRIILKRTKQENNISFFYEDIKKEYSKKFTKNTSINAIIKCLYKYKVLYDMIVSIIFICTFVLIIPFVMVYTKDIKDYNYIRPIFGYILVLAEFVWIVRQPYNDLIKAAGHFKQTKIGAIIETIINICLSIVLVNKYGLIGVAIGTLVAMSYRMLYFINYSSKNILKSNPWKQYFRIIIIAIEFSIVYILSRFLNKIVFTSYVVWTKYAIIIFFITSVVVLIINCVFYRRDMKSIFYDLKKRLSHS